MTTEVIDVEAVELPPERGLSVRPQAHLAVGVGALAAMSDEDFDRNLEAMEKGVQRAARMKSAIMVENEDFGLIPGTNKPTLLKPGAEKLALAYGLTGRFEHHLTYGHSEDEPPLTVVVDCFLHLGGHDGPAIAQGMGMASSFEKRYRWRKGGRVCPDCNKEGVIYTKGRGGQWWHPSDAKPSGGCGANFPKDDARLADQSTADVENPDPFELGNTLLKMAEKRAYVDAVLRATASSGLFSQDMEDLDMGHRPPDPDPRRVDQSTGEIHDEPRDPNDHSNETLRVLGPVSRTGAIARGTGRNSDLQWRETATGRHIGFLLEVGDGKPRPQVVIDGPLGAALYAATNAGGEELKGMKVTVDGEVAEVRVPGRSMLYRITVSRIVTPEFILPAIETLREPSAEEEAEMDAIMAALP